jgi:hypothetical protein
VKKSARVGEIRKRLLSEATAGRLPERAGAYALHGMTSDKVVNFVRLVPNLRAALLRHARLGDVPCRNFRAWTGPRRDLKRLVDRIAEQHRPYYSHPCG